MRIPDINSIIDEIRKDERIGIIASHIGIVKGYSQDGKKIKALEISFDKEKIKTIVNKIKEQESILDVKVKLNEGRLNVGNWVMIVMIAGEIRDKVFPALFEMVDMIKKEATRKKEIY